MADTKEEGPSIVEQLLQLRSLTRLTGAIHEAQVQQLKHWPMVAINHALSSEVRCETDEGGKKSVYIDVEAKKKAPKDLEARLKILSSNVQWLLGNDWKVQVAINKKVVHTARRKPEPKPKPRD